jgi:glycosyltransferase involved in cell wall biosynthesis
VDRKFKVVWLCPYPLDLLVPFGLKLTRPTGGHACSWIINWAAALSQRPEVDLHIITCASRVKRSQSVQYAGYTVHIVRDAIPFTDKNWAGLYDMDARTSFILRKRKLLKKIGELKPDMVHGHGTEDAYGLAAVESGVLSVVSIQGVIADYLRTDPCDRFKAVVRTESKTVRKGRYFMCRTHFDKSFVKSLNQKAHIFHMPEPMNPLFFKVNRAHAEKFRILYVGGFDPRKGLEQLLISVAFLKSSFPDVKVDVIGNGSPEQKDYMLCRAKELGVLDAITFHGFLTAAGIAELHARATVFAITSRNENSPNTLAEALCAGTPSVAFDVGGISSMFVDGESGFLAPAGDSALLAGRIKDLFSNSALCQKFSDKSRRDGLANLPERVAETAIKSYQQMVKESL